MTSLILASLSAHATPEYRRLASQKSTTMSRYDTMRRFMSKVRRMEYGSEALLSAP